MRHSLSEKKAGNGMKAAFLGAAVLATAGAAFYFGTALHATKASGSKPASRKALASTALSLPLFFEPNQGQTAPQVKFLAHGAGYGLFLTADEAVLEIQHSAFSTQHSAPGSRSSRAASSSVIRMRLEGANASARISGASPLPGKSDYFIGNDPSKWHRGIPQFARVEYQAVYPGVDLVYYGDGGQLEYDFRVAPGAAPNQIALSFTGASAHIVLGDSGVSEDSGNSGDLILSTANGDVRFHAPHVYQQDGNTQKAVTGSFRQLAGNKIAFTIGDYDHSRELVIDPILSYSTYLGGSGTEGGLIGANPLNLVKIAIDPGDFIYVAGSTNSTDFPVTDGSTLNSTPGAQNIFISKINPSPAVGFPQLVYSAYLGGSGTDSLAGIAVDKTSNIYVAGTTTSTCATTPTPSCFPTTPNALQTAPAVAGTHGFLSALTFEGNNSNNTSIYTLTYSTYLAGTNAAGNAEDKVTGLAIDSNQNAYVTGVTTSSNSATLQNPFPASPDGYQTVSNNPGN
ncbi:MAG: SBBP repeat-containing protein, partial [Terriglobales bacterium]